ncbi:hypothetical protein WKR88_09465 [Trinickia caryophylli]|nr:hypothetical protein [Trinickia caryophylli]TRX18907.1 hypothetical protein FNF07_12155 [Trinickia caryophylli]WQE10294.1 hypothetical protein U0034_10760 [Trinickia caryophylli]GLU34259.1 hypothetical protein Busp01_41010 [Trinickia caryophylli]
MPAADNAAPTRPMNDSAQGYPHAATLYEQLSDILLSEEAHPPVKHGYVNIPEEAANPASGSPGYGNSKTIALPHEQRVTAPSLKGAVRAKLPFRNWMWIEEGKAARASAPNYGLSDSSQRMSPDAIDVLKNEKITAVVSLNYFELTPEEIESLKNEGIEYLWLPVKDHRAPSVQQLIEGSEFIERNPGATLSYCGFGEGRTGILISAWEIYSGRKSTAQAIADTTAEQVAQKKALLFVPTRRAVAADRASRTRGHTV